MRDRLDPFLSVTFLASIRWSRGFLGPSPGSKRYLSPTTYTKHDVMGEAVAVSLFVCLISTITYAHILTNLRTVYGVYLGF